MALVSFLSFSLGRRSAGKLARKTKEALQGSEEKYRQVVAAAKDAIVVFDAEIRQFVEANKAAEDMYGYTREELLAMRHADITVEKEESEHSFQTMAATGKPVTIPLRYHRKNDGTVFPVEISASTFTANGRRYFCGVVRDISDRLKTEEELRQFSSRLEQMVQERTDELSEANRTLHIEISERRQAEEALKAAVVWANAEKAKSEAIISAIGDSLVIIDPEFRIIYQNRVDMEIIGNHIGEVCYEAFEGRTAVCEGCPAEPAFKDGQIHRKERAASTKAGMMNLDITVSPLRDASGKIIAVIEMVRDITDRMMAEEALRASHEELELLVEERTAELTKLNKQLRDLSTYLQDAREKERAMIAREIHDELGQSLTALKMDLSLLMKRLPRGPRNVIEKAESMAGLIETTIQSVKRISTDLRPGLLDHLGLTAAIDWQAGEFTKRTGIKCDVVFEPEEITVDRDRTTTIFRVFQETLTNVARHAKASKVSVLLKRQDGYLLLHVSDNGEGITKERISDIKSLGLIGMRERVHYWEGALEISGVRNQGTTVSARIPLGEAGERP
jgi:PAS domain S-box-containing protein